LASILGLIGGLIWLRMKGLSTTEAFPFGPYICLVGILWIVDYLFKLHFFTTLFL
ncbi:MAG: hypothetical protein RLY27_242, partial [Pseudomonadota bacterium]